MELFFRSVLIGYSGAMMPGSLLTYTLDKSIKHGPKVGILVSLGHALLELLLVMLIFLGLGTILSTPAAQIIIGFLGGLLLIFFGIGMIRDVYKSNILIDSESHVKMKSGGIMLQSAVISVSNPYFTIWWAIIGMGLMMNAYTLFGIMGVVLFYLGHILADFSWYCFISFLMSKTRKFMSIKVYRVVIAFLGVCLIGFGLNFIISSIKLL